MLILQRASISVNVGNDYKYYHYDTAEVKVKLSSGEFPCYDLKVVAYQN